MKVILPARVANVCPANPPLTHTRFPQNKIHHQSSVKDKPLNYKQFPPLFIMDITLDFLKPLYELVQNEEVQKKLDETARIYWSPVSWRPASSELSSFPAIFCHI